MALSELYKRAIQRSETSSETTRSQRLLFLFQCDLLPGIAGKILKAKHRRDQAQSKAVSPRAKVAGYTFISRACLVCST